MTSITNTELSALLAELTVSPDSNVKSSPQFKAILDLADRDPAGLLASMPKVEGNSRKALGLLSLLLSENSKQWPVLDLLRCYGAVRDGMPEPVKAGRVPEVSQAIQEVLDKIHGKYESLADLIEDSDRPALIAPTGSPAVTLRSLKNIVASFRLPILKSGDRNPVVAIAIPNGPLLATTCFAVAAHFSAAPINPTVGVEQFRADVEQVQARCILTTHEVAEKLQLTDDWVAEHKIDVYFIDFPESESLILTDRNGDVLQTDALTFQPNNGSDICLMLFTSGTSGTKKIVPLTLHLIIFGAVLVIDSWGLSSSDICLNMMPLFHIGGLLRNIFAPILAGGSTICCAAFDPNLFWNVVDGIQPTWYYASPTMHSLILSSAPESPSANKSRFRLICNAAGGLLPSLALQLQEVFRCTVLPSYGMTECMPISTPPLAYNLERTGTSGIRTGPDLAILDGDDNRVQAHNVGRISVRGDPVFYGYLRPDGQVDRSAFTADGWFDTGDLGYLDNDGYLYITGRSKEVINRGGEIISPFEVENAIVAAAQQADSPIFGRVSEALALSVQHDVLQEIVGVVLVTPPNTPRVDLRVLHDALKSSLQQAKWPAVVVYMERLPKSNNKVLRIRLGERLSLPKFTDYTPYHERHWEGICPPDGTSLSQKIPARRCLIDEAAISSALCAALPHGDSVDVFIRQNHLQGSLEAVVAPKQDSFGPDLPEVHINLDEFLTPKMVSTVDNYLIPHRIHWLSHPLPRRQMHPSDVDVPALDRVLRELLQKDVEHLLNTTEGRVVTKVADVLQCDPYLVRPDLDFFSLGGDSLKAGKLIASLRSEFNVTVPISLVFDNGSASSLAKYIDECLESDTSTTSEEGRNLPGCQETYSSTRWWLMLIQLVPMVVAYPMRRSLQWTIFMVALSYTQDWATNGWIFGRLFNLTLCILFAQLLLRVIVPWIGIALKWAIIGRYKEGFYPMWGSYHTRWWMVQKLVDIAGPGMFSWSNYTRVLYYRLMGAKIGKNVTLKNVAFGEWDLLEIHDGAVLERCTVRPFGAERNTTMYLGKIVIGRNASVGLASTVAPGTTVPEGTCIGPNSSSWELDDASEENRDLSTAKAPKSHWALALFGTFPLWGLCWIMSLIPWFAGLTGLVITAPNDSENPLYSILNWFAEAHRIGFHYLALILRAFFSPFLAFGFVVAVKWILDKCFGELTAGPVRGRSTIETWRMNLMRTLMPLSSLHDMTDMMGQHYEGTSIAVRMLGGKVGRRVYWPGTGPSIGDYHLINIGDDVVFGSRSHLVTSDATGSEPVTIGASAMIADRVTLLPGVTVGEGATLGSGSLTRRNKAYTSGATYVGSKGGDAVCLTLTRRSSTPDLLRSSEKWNSGSSSASTSSMELGKTPPDFETSPFGRAFYLKKAPYRVLGTFAIFCYSSFLTVFTRFYWNVPSISSIQIADLFFKGQHTLLGRNAWFDPLALFAMTTAFIAVITTLQALLALAVIVAAKWILIGRRQPGNYDWDKSSYCQRWQLFLGVERLRRSCFRGHGILGMLTGTHWIVMYFRSLGATIGKDCSLFANGSPSLYFTEPDLLTLGDRVAVDDASLVGHLNTRGKFDLNRLSVGNRCVLRTGSRLLSGATMMDDSCLLEHTLVMSGDIVDEGQTLQGWPAAVFQSQRARVKQE